MMFFIFNGKRSSEYGVGISGSGTFDAPERDVESVPVPGRNGDILLDNNRFLNIGVKYPAYIAEEMPKKIGAFAAMLSSADGYARLEDTYHPEEYRMAQFKGGMKVNPVALNVGATFDVEFDCKPQRFLKIGEEKTELTNTGTLFNPTMFPSKPLLRIYGTGTVYLNTKTITVSSASVYTDVDCEIMEAYKGSVNCNANVTLADGLVLKPGSNTVTLSGVTKVEITPRWWTI